MRILVPEHPCGWLGDAWRFCVADFVADRSVPVDFVSRHAYTSGPARHLPFGVRQTLAPASALLDRRQLDLLRETAEPYRSHQALPVRAGRVELDLTLDRNEVTLIEISAVVDETPPWWDERIVLPSPGAPA